MTTGQVGRNVEVKDDSLDFVASLGLNPQKARVLLRLALLKTTDLEDDPALFRRVLSGRLVLFQNFAAFSAGIAIALFFAMLLFLELGRGESVSVTPRSMEPPGRPALASSTVPSLPFSVYSSGSRFPARRRVSTLAAR